MPSSMWWPAGSWRQRSSRSVPRKSRCASGLNTPILLIQPPRLVETLTSGDVVTRRAATSGWLPRAVSSRPNVSWVETGLLVMAPASLGMGRPGRGGTGRLLSVPPTDCAQPGLGRAGREAVPLRVGREPDLGPEGLDLGRREQRGVVERVARDRQAPALDGVREHDARAGRLRVAGAVGVGEDLEVVAAEVLHQRREVVVRHAGHGGRHVAVGAGQEPLPQLGAAEGEERLVLLVRHVVDVAAQVLRRPAGRTPPAAGARTSPRRRASRSRRRTSSACGPSSRG